MSDPVLKMTTSDGQSGGHRMQRLNWAMGDVDRARRSAGLPFPFGTAILQVRDEHDTLVVHWSSAESMVVYGRFLLEAWREHGNTRVEFVMPDDVRLKLDASTQGGERTAAPSKPSREIRPMAFRG
ncbi:hypothetical protein FAZ69_08525 [Trinickia terrae]|uniref:Uncharacterized protein n=1 Tax=Trinickia terrae TaxID=2571161 RepID=A0A4U1I9M5_9BURK|nr:hypothetical protein [Trinickia terrae]TKC90182.1 hypothetical protein FAZ69_08525 [Trinickia terrae]